MEGADFWVWALVVAGSALLFVLALWGVVIQMMVKRLEREHRDAYLDLAARSPRLPVRMAASRELQRAMGRAETLPGTAGADPGLVRLYAREQRLRFGLVVLTLLTALAIIAI